MLFNKNVGVGVNMKDDKWKTQPCKECLVKNVCNKACYDIYAYSTYEEVLRFVKENHLESICLSCGDNITPGRIVWCYRCKNRGVDHYMTLI